MTTTKQNGKTTRQPRAIIIAGPNGAGKTTFAREFLVAEGACPTFLNADLIAAGLSPFKPEDANVKAIRLMAEQMRDLVAKRRDFAVESTLAGRTYVGLIKDWRAAGYHVKIVYLRLDFVRMAIERVKLRVAEGGHNVPEEVIRRRFLQGWKNFCELYRPLADVWQVYDCTKPTLVLLEQGVQEWPRQA